MTKRGRILALVALATVSACSNDDGSYESPDFRPNVGIVNEREPLVMSNISSSARFGDTVIFRMPVGLLVGTTPTEFVASVGSERGGEVVEVSPSRILLDPGARGILNIKVRMPIDASRNEGSQLVTVGVALDSSSSDDSSIGGYAQIQIEVADTDQPLRPTVADDFVFWGNEQSVDVLANDVAFEGGIDPSSLRIIETFAPITGAEPFVESGRISIPEAPDRSAEGARIEYQVCTTEQQCSTAALTLYIEGTF